MITRRTRRMIPTAALVLAVAALSGPAPGPAGVAAHGPDPIFSGKLYGQDQKLMFRWRGGSVPPAAIRTAILAAAADVNASRASRAATFAFDADGASLVGYGPAATCGVNGIACFTRTAPTSFTMWLREHGRVFDWGTLKWCQMYAAPPNGCYDAETIALDEFGHVEILDHHDNFSDDRDYLDAVVQTFSRTKPKDGWDEHVLGRCDVATLQREYDVPAASTKISTCLDLGTTVTLSASPASIPYGATTKFTATLKIKASTAYKRLSGNALSTRSVKLQRRPPGTTTWTTIATMSAGSTAGTYAASVSMQTTAEFRAQYSAPASEGLRSSTSSTVRVTVGACSGICPQSSDR